MGGKNEIDFLGGTKKSLEFGKIYKQIADHFKVQFLNLAEFVK